MKGDLYETCHTVHAYYDGVRSGIADFHDQPHWFESEFVATDPADVRDVFRLTPLDPETFQLAMEDWAIFRRWETAYGTGATTLQTHPALPEDRARYERLAQQLKGKLVIDPRRMIRAKADFVRREGPGWNGVGMAPLAVRWTPVVEQ